MLLFIHNKQQVIPYQGQSPLLSCGSPPYLVVLRGILSINYISGVSL